MDNYEAPRLYKAEKPYLSILGGVIVGAIAGAAIGGAVSLLKKTQTQSLADKL